MEYLEEKKRTAKKTPSTKRKWSELMDNVILYILNNFKNNVNIWLLCERLTSIPAEECRERYLLLTNGPVHKRIPFSEEEDSKILELHSKYGSNWSKIAKELKTRTRKQIRERYLNILDTKNYKGPFTEEEDLKIFQLYNKYGNKWAFISKFIENRTTDKVRVRYHSHIKKYTDYYNSLLSTEENTI